MSGKTATERLREMLDERGVEWGTGFGGDTLWTGRHGIEWRWDKQEDTLAMYSHAITPEQVIAATLGGGKLTAEQVRDAIFNGSAYASYDGAKYYADGISMQAIADTLNATLGGGECEVETMESWLPAERYHRCKHCGAFFAVMNASGDIQPCVCPNCGKAVKR